jgi:hypothetical protein
MTMESVGADLIIPGKLVVWWVVVKAEGGVDLAAKERKRHKEHGK